MAANSCLLISPIDGKWAGCYNLPKDDIWAMEFAFNPVLNGDDSYQVLVGVCFIKACFFIFS